MTRFEVMGGKIKLPPRFQVKEVTLADEALDNLPVHSPPTSPSPPLMYRPANQGEVVQFRRPGYRLHTVGTISYLPVVGIYSRRSTFKIHKLDLAWQPDKSLPVAFFFSLDSAKDAVADMLTSPIKKLNQLGEQSQEGRPQPKAFSIYKNNPEAKFGISNILKQVLLWIGILILFIYSLIAWLSGAFDWI